MPRWVSQIFSFCGLFLLGWQDDDPALNLSGKFALMLQCQILHVN